MSYQRLVRSNETRLYFVLAPFDLRLCSNYVTRWRKVSLPCALDKLKRVSRRGYMHTGADYAKLRRCSVVSVGDLAGPFTPQ